jgi:hypothetical protein
MLSTGGAAMREPQAAALKDDDLINRWPSPSLVNVVVVGGQTDPYHQVANMSCAKSVSIDKWMDRAMRMLVTTTAKARRGIAVGPHAFRKTDEGVIL